jgi:hypothetical protein
MVTKTLQREGGTTIITLLPLSASARALDVLFDHSNNSVFGGEQQSLSKQITE